MKEAHAVRGQINYLPKPLYKNLSIKITMRYYYIFKFTNSFLQFSNYAY